MRLAIKSKLRGKARRLFVPLNEFSFASFPIEVTRISARCAGRIASQVSVSRRTGTTPTNRQTLSSSMGIWTWKRIPKKPQPTRTSILSRYASNAKSG